MGWMLERARRALEDGTAAALTEYTLLVGLIAIAVLIASLTSIGGSLSGFIDTIATTLGGGS
jgi:Flp pilus assembly pilin Flp